MAEHKHWKTAFPSDYFGHQHLPEDGSDAIVEIKDVKRETVRSRHGTETCLVAYITANPEKWILCKTNAHTIEKVTGAAFDDEWVGKKIQLYKTKTTSPDGLVDCVRVRDFPPKE